MIVMRVLRKRAGLVLGPVIGIALTGYFAYNLVEGDRGLKAWFRLNQEIRTATADLEATRAQRAALDLKATDGWTSETDDVKRRYRAFGGVRLCKAWETMPQITIAAMEKMAVGGGVALALACDWRVLGRDAYLYVPEVKIGLNLQWGALPRLITLVGPARAKRRIFAATSSGIAPSPASCTSRP